MNTYGITLTEAAYNGHKRQDNVLYDAWTVTLCRNGKQTFLVDFKMGTGHNGAEPELEDVLNSLQADARIVEWDEYDDVLSGMTFTKARRLAETLESETKRLRRFLGDAYPEFLNEEYDR